MLGRLKKIVDNVLNFFQLEPDEDDRSPYDWHAEEEKNDGKSN